MRKTTMILAALTILLVMFCAEAYAEESGFQPADLPVVVLNIDGGQEEIDRLNNSEDHSYRCTGTLDILVPEGYSGQIDGRYPQKNVSGLKIRYIRGRGQGSWGMDKHPYKIKLEDKADLFGMGKARTWVLLANYFDDSLMRNWMVQWMGEQVGLEYTPQGVFVEVVMNGDYLGSYCLCEQVQLNKARVAIDELKEEDREEPAIQGGYLLEFCPNEEEGPDAFETARGLRLGTMNPSFDPENDGYVNDIQKNYIRDYVQKAEDAIFSEDGSYAEYLDLQSLADYWWIMEFVMNEDAFYTDSQHMFKPRFEPDGSEGRLHFGPLWDFDASLGNGQTVTEQETGFGNTVFIWMDELRKKPEFREVLKERWLVLDEKLEELVRDGGALDRAAAVVKGSWYRDEERWHAFKEERDMLPLRSFEQETEHLKKWISLRREWIREHLDELGILTYTLTFRGEGMEEESYDVPAYMRLNVYTYMEETPEAEGKQFVGWAAEDGTLTENFVVSQDTVLTARFE